MQHNTTQSELLELERQYWQAMKDHDVQTMLALSDDPCVVTGPQGVGRLDHQTLATMMSKPNWTLEDFEFKNDALEVSVVNDDIGIVAYKVHELLTVDGTKIALDASESSTWVRRDGHWVCAQHSEAIEGDPFGRDRHGTASGQA